MGDTWGISGPDFLRFYLVAVVVLAAYSIWWRLRVGSGTDSGRSPRPDELAYLNGGPSTAVYSSLAGLRTAGVITVGQFSELEVAGEPPPGSSRLDHAVHGAAARRMSARVVQHDSGVTTALAEIQDRLIRAGWVLDDDQRRQARLGGWLTLVLVGLGVLRIFAGLANDRPVGYLVLLTALTLAVAVALLWVPRHGRTNAGRRVLARARQAHQHLRPNQNPAWSTYGFTAAAMGVALFGTEALWAGDLDLARQVGLTRNNGDGGSGAASGGDGGGGGGGCGGGGCGGGGCGG